MADEKPYHGYKGQAKKVKIKYAINITHLCVQAGETLFNY